MLNKKLLVGLALVTVVGLGVGLWSTSSADNLSSETASDQTELPVYDPDNSQILIGEHPGSCGYVWDGERGGWHRPWDPDSFISAEDKPEWQEFSPVFEEPQNDIFVGGTPGSCGYVWSVECGGWYRPWDPDSFIPVQDKPEWDKFIPSSSSMSLAELEETAIYAAVIRQLAIVDDTFGGNLNPKTLYVIKNTVDGAGNTVEGQQSDTRLITETMQNEISSILNDISIEIIWIDRFEDAEFEKSGFEVKSGGAIITLGNIYLRESGPVQVAGSIYIANLAAGGTTYILEEVDESWEITGRAGPTWMS